MPQIEVLDEQTIDKIAAGEVVERPSSVVKELVENAIDAKATAITVEIKEGGTSLIRITDNGCGIEAAQIPIAFYRHSTSKIRKVEDLVRISSLGFRGEALSSIAAVAQVELITKTPEQFTGSRYLIEGGKELSLEEIGAPNGTTFLVKNLFYNTPVRRKFLKSSQTEAGYVNDLMERIALSHPEISFKFINNGQIRLHTSGNGKLKDIIYHIYGRDIAANLLEIHAEYEGFSVDGFIGKPIIARGNRNFESYFINGRYIKSTLIAKALEDGYRGFMMQHKYPFTVLTISLDGTLVDVNVHPNKMELRFSNGEILYQQLAALLSTRLRESELIPKVTVHEEKKQEKRPQIQPQEAPEPFEQKRLERLRAAVAKDSPYERKYPERNRPETATSGQGTVGQASVLREQITYGTECPGSFPVEQKVLCEEKTDSSETQKQEKNGEVFFQESVNTDSQEVLAEHVLQQTLFDTAEQKAEEQEDPGGSDFSDADLKSKQEWKFLSKQARPHHRIIGQLFETYWLVEYQEQFYMIDQHAAHEKVLFERTMKTYREKEFTSQMISPPIILSLTMQEEVLLKKFLPEFEKLGYEIEHFGGKEYAVNAVPGNLYGLNGQSLLLELMDGLGNMSEKDTPDLVVEKIASMSCKAAVKGNQKLSRPEIEHLIDELLTLENPYFCPHGRPVIVSMTKYEIEKKFKRIV
ncbi:DNA mismatch repair endonuclease MutL [uncultured Eubacterium sp.]|uniref:DNA mismatch repair endonuclease MutL n=1 Tax=uncultured Eubacterium sp. TaxID=165185 RepID=UPI00259A9650|nr:DNA mismatch repair endonuclease MutL [uncultured Eubacterium sp.]